MTSLNAANISLAQPALPTALGSNVAAATKAKLKEKSQEFEAYFVQQFVALTRPDLSDNPLLGGGYGEQMFNQNMDEQIAKAITQRGGFGVGNQVYTELLKQQERQNNNMNTIN